MYKTIQDLEEINFKKLKQEDRLAIMLNIIDNLNDITPFKDYFLNDDLYILREKAFKDIKEIIEVLDDDDLY
jgi:hypothetical protein